MMLDQQKYANGSFQNGFKSNKAKKPTTVATVVKETVNKEKVPTPPSKPAAVREEPYKEEDMDDPEVDEESDEFTSDESSENNDEGSDDPEYDPKFHVEDFRKSSSRKPKRRKTF